MYLNILDVIEEELATTFEVGVPDIIPSLSSAKRIFVAGAGRSKMVASMFAMRLMHCGFNVHVVGEVTVPSIGRDDVFFIVSGSGNTSQLIDFAVKAMTQQAVIILVTASMSSTLKSLSNVTIQIGRVPREMDNCLPLGGRFELSTLIFLESLVLQIMKRKGLTDSDLAAMHANLE